MFKQAVKSVYHLVTNEDFQNETNAMAELSLQDPAVGEEPPASTHISDSKPGVEIPLEFSPGQGGHRPTNETRRLLREIGGRDQLVKFTNLFYERSFEDAHIDQFLRDHDDPHGERFASWISEKFGDTTMPWTKDRVTRKRCPFQSHGYVFDSAIDRSSAHYTAWHSPKRSPEKFGQHFKLDDARVWMRLHFWAARESGVFDHKGFMGYYIKFIGHFVSVYESSATQFARESARWSKNKNNIHRYTANANVMADVIGVSLSEALKDLPRNERGGRWPYPSADSSRKKSRNLR